VENKDNSVQLPSPDTKTALVIAHPSHELRVHGWLQLARPHVFVMTDGAGRSGRPRLPSTTRTLSQVGAKTGSVYGRVTDLELYAAILAQNFDLFIRLADELADSFISESTEYVVGDAAEGYSSAHDICRLLINAAVEIAGLESRDYTANYDFVVIAAPEEYSREDDDAIWIHLDDEMFSRKIATAHAYDPKLAADIDAALRGERFQGIKRFSEPQIAGQVDVEVTELILTTIRSRPELYHHINDALGGVELDAFRVECLRPVRHHGPSSAVRETPPFYEMYGEKLVAAGRYEQVIRYRDHISPLADALHEHVERSS
jgi:hypothetical protein